VVVGEGWSMSTRWIWVGIIDGMVSGVFGVAFCVEGGRKGGREGRKCHMINKDRDGWNETRCMPRTESCNSNLVLWEWVVTFWLFSIACFAYYCWSRTHFIP